MTIPKARFRVTFHQLRQDPLAYGSDGKIVSRVFFSLEKDGKRQGEYHADLKEVGGSEMIEVSSVKGYDGTFDHDGFSIAARKYFRDVIASKRTSISGKYFGPHTDFFVKNAEFNF